MQKHRVTFAGGEEFQIAFQVLRQLLLGDAGDGHLPCRAEIWFELPQPPCLRENWGARPGTSCSFPLCQPTQLLRVLAVVIVTAARGAASAAVQHTPIIKGLAGSDSRARRVAISDAAFPDCIPLGTEVHALPYCSGSAQARDRMLGGWAQCSRAPHPGGRQIGTILPREKPRIAATLCAAETVPAPTDELRLVLKAHEAQADKAIKDLAASGAGFVHP